MCIPALISRSFVTVCICYCFSHLIGLRSVTWLSLLYKFTRFSIYFLFLSDEGSMLEMLDYTIRIGSTPTILYFDMYLYSAYAAHFVYFTFGSFTAATLCLISRSFVTACICYCFCHLIGLRSVTWLSLLYKFTRFSIYFLFLSDEGANARNVRLYYPYWQYTDLFIFRFVSLPLLLWKQSIIDD